MKAIAQLVVRVFELCEAEGKTLLAVVRGEGRRVQATAMNMAMGVAFLLVSVLLFVAGVYLIAAGLMWWLETQVSRPLAASLTGLAILAVGAGCLACFKVIAERHQP